MLLDAAGKALAKLAQHERRKPIAHEVALLSRQSAKVSRDFALLHAELAHRLGAHAVALNVCDSELDGKARFAGNMLAQLRIEAQSRVVVLDGYNPVVCVPPKSARTKVVQLWHASGAVKKFGYQALDTPAGRSSDSARAAHMHENYDAIIAAGPGAVDVYAEAFGYPRTQVHALGMPHLDYLLADAAGCEHTARRDELAAEFPFLADSRRVVLYAPTLRKGKSYEGWETRYLDALAHACEAACGGVDDADSIWLVYAGHPLDHDFDAGLLDAHPCIRTCPGAETLDLLGFADCVVTDYSSVALEAGLVGCNVCFYVPDLAEYELSPGLNVDLRDPAVCLASEDADELMSAALTGGAPGFDAWRAFTARYFEGLQPDSTARIADFIQSLL